MCALTPYLYTRNIMIYKIYLEKKCIICLWSYFRQILANCEASLEISRSELEKVWLYYEIAKANHELGNKSEIARTAIKKSIREAKSLRNLVWNINSCVLASRIEMKSQARTEARLLLQDALDCAKKMGNESVVDFLEVVST